MFTYEQQNGYITLFKEGKFICNCDNWREIEEEEEICMQ